MEKVKVYQYVGFVTALIATLGSLFFSEILHLPPCVLCWYQRILMYPLVWIIAVGIIKKDKNLALYVLPLSIIGSLIALYHTLLQANIIPESVAPCVQGISCTTVQIRLLGIFTIPSLSLIAFIIVSLCMIQLHRLRK